MFTEEYSQMVVVKDIEVYSMCEHHMLPFFGKAHVAYIPNGRIVGLSKIPRVVDAFARRLQVQERLTNEIRDCIHDTLKPLGVAVVMECNHLCMQMRGIQKQNSVTTTIGVHRDLPQRPSYARGVHQADRSPIALRRTCSHAHRQTERMRDLCTTKRPSWNRTTSPRNRPAK